MTKEEFKAWQGNRTAQEVAEICCCSRALIAKIRLGIRSVTPWMERIIELHDENISLKASPFKEEDTIEV